MKNLDPQTLDSLLLRVKKKDQNAFRELCLAYNTIIYRFVAIRLKDDATSEEVVSDVLFQVWEHPERFDHSCQFSTWLLSIARHKLIDRQRAAKPQAEDIEDFSEVLEGNLLDGFETLDRKQTAEVLRGCVDKLSADHRIAVHLVFYEGMTLVEAAVAENIAEGTMKTRLFHARQRLKACAQIRLGAR